VGVDVGMVSRVRCRRILGGGVIAYGGSAPPLSEGPQGHCLRREIGATQQGIPGADERRAAYVTGTKRSRDRLLLSAASHCERRVARRV
jgi:hypothetical protein